jgi:MFS family permease
MTVDETYPSAPAAAWAVALLVLACLFAFIDKQILSLLVTPIKTDLLLSDTQIGLLQGVAIGGLTAVVGYPVAIIVDRGNRMRLLCFSSLIWSVFTALSGMSRNFTELFACRLLVGAAEVGLYPAAFSLLADLYAPASRMTAMLIFRVAGVLCGGASIAFGGSTIDWVTGALHAGVARTLDLQAWRVTFVLFATPGILISLLLWMTPEPTRKLRVEELASSDAMSLRQFLREDWETPACIVLGMMAAGTGVDMMLVWAPSIFGRDYGFSPGRAGWILGLLLVVGSMLAGGLSDAIARSRRSRWGKLTTLRIMMIGAVAAAVICPLFLFVHRTDLVLATILLYFIPAYMAIMAGPLLLTEITPNHLRGQVLAIANILALPIGFIAPVLIGALSDHVFRGHGGLLISVGAASLLCNASAPLLLRLVRVPPGRRSYLLGAAGSSRPA